METVVAVGVVAFPEASGGDTETYEILSLILNVPIATKVVCFSRLLKCLISLYGKQCGPRSDYSYRSILIWVHTVCNRGFLNISAYMKSRRLMLQLWL